jgi:hypothetical protein
VGWLIKQLKQVFRLAVVANGILNAGSWFAHL